MRLMKFINVFDNPALLKTFHADWLNMISTCTYCSFRPYHHN